MSRILRAAILTTAMLALLLRPGTTQTELRAPISDDRLRIQNLLRQFARAVSAESIPQMVALIDGAPTIYADRLKKEWGGIFQQFDDLQLNWALTLAGVNRDAALVRQSYVLSGRLARVNTKSQRINIRRATIDFLLHRKGDAFLFGGDQWIQVDLVQAIQESLEQGDPPATPQVRQLVTQVRGGQWFPLRQMVWAGRMGNYLRVPEEHEGDFVAALRAVVLEQEERNQPGNLYLFLQWDGVSWSVAAALWQPFRLISGNDPTTSLEAEVRQKKSLTESQFGNAELHRDYARALSRAGLYVKALEELDKANALVPGTVPLEEYRAMQARADLDPQVVSARQSLFEMSVGIASDHPRLLLQKSLEEEGVEYHDPIVGLKRALLYSRLGDYQSTYREWARAVAMNRKRPSATQQEVFSVFSGNIERRLREATFKPPCVLVSDIFTVRFHMDDPSLPNLLVSLEQAQHTVYADFAIPLGHTEIVLFPTLSDFRKFFQECMSAPPSDATVAYTNGEEIVTYAQSKADTLSVVAHEFGHVAVQRMVNWREMPKWLNEGIACCVQGGYWDYEQRCLHAYRTGKLMNMEQLLEWKAQGDDSFIAYSQANAMVYYILARFGRESVLNILRDFGSGMDMDSAFRKNIGLDQRQLLIAWVTDTFAKDNP